MMASRGGGGGGYKNIRTVKRLNSFTFTCLIDFSDKKTGFEGLVIVRVSRFSSKFGGGEDNCDAKNSIAFCVPSYATFVSKDSHLTHRTSASEEETDPCR